MEPDPEATDDLDPPTDGLEADAEDPGTEHLERDDHAEVVAPPETEDEE